MFPVWFTFKERANEQSLSWRASVERTACGSEKRSVEYWFKGATGHQLAGLKYKTIPAPADASSKPTHNIGWRGDFGG